ncbi:MAG: tripartite tricarboxylate transporter substrate binding protein, partial [Betaproteobacteria bacterium]|nr:tripartite tricarboxylate transporter substrate binding protein [Betaproteobacteria bacterium]
MSNTLLARNFLHLCLLAFASLVGSSALAQPGGNYPSKPVTLIVTYPPGGGADAMARLLAPKMSEALGQSVVVENKPGAGGQIGAAAVAKAAPDGYTLMLDASSFAVNPSLYPKLPYDPMKAFKPVGVVALFPNVVLVNANFPAQNVSDLISVAKKAKDSVFYASSGNGSAQHLAGALFESATGVDMVHVPYKGGGPMTADALGGQIDLVFDPIQSVLPHIVSGKLRALAVTSKVRSPVLPTIPTVAEQGYPQFESIAWWGVFAPAKTPPEIIGRVYRELSIIF